MFWYLLGAAACLAAAMHLKRNVLAQKNLYQAALILAMGFLLAAAAGWADGKAQKEMKVARNEPGQGNQEKEFIVDIPGELNHYPLALEIEERKLTKAQRKQYLEKAKKELDAQILGENVSKDEITGDLYLPEYLQQGAVEASYRFSDYDVFHSDGTMDQEPKKPVLVEVSAQLDCQGETCLYQFSVQAVPRQKSRQEQLAEKLMGLVSSQNREEANGYVELPGKVEGKEVRWRQQGVDRSLIVVFMAAAVAAAIFFREKEEKKRKQAERETQMMADYSGIVSKLSLLLGAGMNISLAWEKIADSYQQKRRRGETDKRYAYEEMVNTLHEIQDGVGELQAYENFGSRCQLSVYRRLSAMIVQNVRKGSQGMQKLLEQEEWEAYEQRKAHARQMGEEAGTKLLLPMGIMLVIVLAVLVIPAGLALDI